MEVDALWRQQNVAGMGSLSHDSAELWLGAERASSREILRNRAPAWTLASEFLSPVTMRPQ